MEYHGRRTFDIFSERGVSMNDKQFKLAIGALLHDIGKVVYRTRLLDPQAHPLSGQALISQYLKDPEIDEIMLYHHARDLRNAGIADDSLAYVVYFADNIAAGTDQREVEGESPHWFNPGLPLASVFNLLNNNETHLKHRLSGAEEINMPTEVKEIQASDYNRLVQELKSGLGGIKWGPDYINSVLELLEAHLSFVPSSTLIGEVADISLYDHQRLTAALASSIYNYLLAHNRHNFKQELLTREAQFREEKAFLIFSCDLSGIQSFIYTITSKGALKALRARSFYLEILIEHIVDTLLKATDLSRANLIYTGGGHAYILLPNIEEVIRKCRNILDGFNQWFINRMGTRLFVAYAFQECNGNDLMNIPRQENPYQEIFSNLSQKLGKHKLRRYEAADIRHLNKNQAENSDRECNCCGTTNQLLDQENICQVCSSLQNLSREIVRQETLLVSSKTRLEPFVNVRLPSAMGDDCYLAAMPESELTRLLAKGCDDILSVYAINRMYTGYGYSTRLWMGNYFYDVEGDMATFEKLAIQSEGIDRLGVLRADVDNLGAAFTNGFVREREENVVDRNRYLTLSRFATLSRQLSMFFKHHINGLLRGQTALEGLSLKPDLAGGRKKAVIVYSGGDDMFIIGSWNDVIELAVDLRHAFRIYTADSLSFSAGIGLYPDKYPVSRMAEEVADLEYAAKNIDDNKDGLALLGQSISKNREGELSIRVNHLYKWDAFQARVVGQKLRLLQMYFQSIQGRDQAAGNSFLYRLYEYLVGAQDDRINIARYAYLLGRMAPSGSSVPMEVKEAYRQFSEQMYRWALDDQDRQELLTAITIDVYLSRKGEEEQ
ncbi:MAG: type III-A CRISPR-associated protein Cas10/Csm1 [Syntrophomonadales bacterium]